MLLRSADFLQDDDADPDIIPDYDKSDADVCCTGMVDLFTNANEISIRSSIQEVLGTLRYSGCGRGGCQPEVKCSIRGTN